MRCLLTITKDTLRRVSYRKDSYHMHYIIIYCTYSLCQGLFVICMSFVLSVIIGPFHLIAAPPLLKGFLRIYPLRKRRSKCRPSYPLGKTTILFKAQRSRLAYPLGNYPYLSLPSPKNSCTFNRGGGGVRLLNGMAHYLLALRW